MAIHQLQYIHPSISSHDHPPKEHKKADYHQHHPVGEVARPGVHHHPGDCLYDGKLSTKAQEQQHEEKQEGPNNLIDKISQDFFILLNPHNICFVCFTRDVVWEVRHSCRVNNLPEMRYG